MRQWHLHRTTCFSTNPQARSADIDRSCSIGSHYAGCVCRDTGDSQQPAGKIAASAEKALDPAHIESTRLLSAGSAQSTGSLAADIEHARCALFNVSPTTARPLGGQTLTAPERIQGALDVPEPDSALDSLHGTVGSALHVSDVAKPSMQLDQEASEPIKLDWKAAKDMYKVEREL